MRRHIDEIIRGGPRVLLRKGLILADLALVVLLGALPLLLVRALRPLVVIRFGALVSYRIGPYASEPEIYLAERDVGMHGGRNVDVFYNMPSICNRQLKRMWDRTLRVIQPARPVGRLNHWVPGGRVHEVPSRSYQQRDIYGALPRTRMHLAFTEEEEEMGHAGLRELGVPDGAPFVCFHARDSAYGETLAPTLDVGRVDYRNSSIHTYVPAAEELTRRGYFALRMGAVVEEALSVDNPMIIDYATRARTELLDLYLSAKCKFFIGSAVGITYLPMIFRRPTVHTNFVPIGVLVAWQPHDLCIPKKLWLRDKGQFMTLSEILQSGAGMFARTWQYKRMGIELVNSTPEEITAVVMEMEERLRGTWKTTQEDEELQRRFWSHFDEKSIKDYMAAKGVEELQRRFWSHFDPTAVNRVPQARIGAEYLRQNRWLLGEPT